ncbi:ribonucleases P/MRP protein subunit POP7 [Rhypophila decipiens]|uniref:Ribonucleases P/MRP protein subunit POP7 n=1 Tax=Rhypophila decipiens TaxID=261697 RepID=A0AAN7B5M2_9PEZI|nr:ribonucleases P/MRP protein subunit POP7 [Rhypophila decipiens]
MDTETSTDKPLPNRPQEKMPGLPKGSRIHKRPLPNAPFNLRQVRREHKQIVRQSSSSSQPVPDLDGYIMPPRAGHTVIIKVSSKAPFMSLVKRVRKALENGPQKTKGLPLTARIAAMEVEKKTKDSNMGPITDALDDVVLIGTGRAIQKTVEVGCYFTRDKSLLVIPRTRSLAAIDDIEMDDDEVDIEDGVRTRHVSCLEVGIRWA